MMRLLRLIYGLIQRYVPQEWTDFLYDPEVNVELKKIWEVWHWIPDGLVILFIVWKIWKHSSIRKFNLLLKKAEVMDLERFARVYAQNSTMNRVGSLTDNDTPGVYIILNSSKNRALVYATYTLLHDVNEQMQGNKCRTLFTDLQSGDEISIRMIPFRDSGFKSLKAMEKVAVRKFKAGKGYNIEL